MHIFVSVGIFMFNMITFHIFGMSSGSFSEYRTEDKFKAVFSSDLLHAISIPSFNSAMSCIEAFSAHIVPCCAKDSVYIFMLEEQQVLRALGSSMGYVELFKKINELRKQGFFEDEVGLQLKKDHYLIVNGVENSIRAALLIMSLKIINPDQVLVYRDVGKYLDFKALGVVDNNQIYIDKESLSRLREAYDRVLQNLPMDIVVASRCGQSGQISLSNMNASINPGVLAGIRQKVLRILHRRVSDVPIATDE